MTEFLFRLFFSSNTSGPNRHAWRLFRIKSDIHEFIRIFTRKNLKQFLGMSTTATRSCLMNKPETKNLCHTVTVPLINWGGGAGPGPA
jgi:hypothetical protein